MVPKYHAFCHFKVDLDDDHLRKPADQMHLYTVASMIAVQTRTLEQAYSRLSLLASPSVQTLAARVQSHRRAPRSLLRHSQGLGIVGACHCARVGHRSRPAQRKLLQLAVLRPAAFSQRRDRPVQGHAADRSKASRWLAASRVLRQSSLGRKRLGRNAFCL